MDLAERIRNLYEQAGDADRDDAREAFAALRAELSAGRVRAAEPDPTAPTGWRVNAWVKQGILVGFRCGDVVPFASPDAASPYLDKDTLPLRPLSAASGVRLVPGGSSVRDGAYLGSGVICMPPMYINIGAWVGDGSLIDSHALVGSCAQVGSGVHVSAGAQIGGVLEPVGALPVVVEDDALVGGNTGLYEGAVVKRRAVIGAGTVLTGSTPIYDLPQARIIRPAAGEPTVVPEGAVVVPGARAVTAGAGPEWGLSLATPVIVKYRDERTDTADGARGVDPVAAPVVDLARALVDIDSTSGNEAAATDWLAARLRADGYRVTEQPVADDRVNVIATVGPADPEVVFSTHIDCVPPFFPSRVEGDRLYGRGACDAKGILAAQIAALGRLRAAGEERAGLLVVVGEEHGSAGAHAANRLATRCRHLINGEPTDNRLATATKGVYRVRLSATGRAVHSAYPELGASAVEPLLDALVALRDLDLPADPDLGPTTYTVGLIAGGVAPNVVPPAAEADVNFRTVGPSGDVRARLDALPVGAAVTVEEVLEVPPVRLTTLPGFPTAAFNFTTDIPFLTAWGQPLLVGPGSIHVAHTADEHVRIGELVEAVGLYERLARELLPPAG